LGSTIRFLDGIDTEKEILPRRGYVAWVTSYEPVKNKMADGSHACIIWFDNGYCDIIESMNKMLDRIDWESVAQDWDYWLILIIK